MSLSQVSLIPAIPPRQNSAIILLSSFLAYVSSKVRIRLAFLLLLLTGTMIVSFTSGALWLSNNNKPNERMLIGGELQIEWAGWLPWQSFQSNIPIQYVIPEICGRPLEPKWRAESNRKEWMKCERVNSWIMNISATLAAMNSRGRGAPQSALEVPHHIALTEDSPAMPHDRGNGRSRKIVVAVGEWHLFVGWNGFFGWLFRLSIKIAYEAGAQATTIKISSRQQRRRRRSEKIVTELRKEMGHAKKHLLQQLFHRHRERN